MKVITQYQCEICSNRYYSEQAAAECESRGVAECVPIGMLHGDSRPGSFYEGITLAVAGNDISKHHNYIKNWACRDNEHGDSLGKEVCGGYHSGAGLKPMVLTDNPSFHRMVAYLKSQAIPVTVWDGKRPVPLDEWMKARGHE